MELLPIGSIVKTKLFDLNLMIIGYYPVTIMDEKKYRYLCCFDKIGIVRPNGKLRKNKEIYFINDSDIEDILFVGYQNTIFFEYQEWIESLEEKVFKDGEMSLEELYSKLLKFIADRKKEKNEK